MNDVHYIISVTSGVSNYLFWARPVNKCPYFSELDWNLMELVAKR